jgi:hypothetical protein
MSLSPAQDKEDEVIKDDKDIENEEEEEEEEGEEEEEEGNRPSTRGT